MIVQGFPRDGLNDAYVKAFQSGPQSNQGRVGDLIATKGAIDYLAALERDFHGQLAGRVRCLVWASARRAGHGADDHTGVFNIVEQYLETILDAGTAVANEPPTNDAQADNDATAEDANFGP